MKLILNLKTPGNLEESTRSRIQIVANGTQLCTAYTLREWHSHMYIHTTHIHTCMHTVGNHNKTTTKQYRGNQNTPQGLQLSP